VRANRSNPHRTPSLYGFRCDWAWSLGSEPITRAAAAPEGIMSGTGHGSLAHCALSTIASGLSTNLFAPPLIGPPFDVTREYVDYASGGKGADKRPEFAAMIIGCSG
jgi:hypothetical protein